MLSLAAFPVHASSQEAASRLVKLINETPHIQKTVDVMVQAQLQHLDKMLAQQIPCYEGDMKKELHTILHRETRMEKYSDIYAGIYAQHFSESELNEIIALQSNPTMKKFTALLPQIMQQTQAAVAERIQANMQQEIKTVVASHMQREECRPKSQVSE